MLQTFLLSEPSALETQACNKLPKYEMNQHSVVDENKYNYCMRLVLRILEMYKISLSLPAPWLRNFMNSPSLFLFLKFFWFSVGWMKANFCPDIWELTQNILVYWEKGKTKYYYHIMVASKNGGHKGKELGKIVSKMHISVKIDTCSNHNRNRLGNIYTMHK